MNILMTGGAGYIGSHLAIECLNRGHEVTIIDNFSNSFPEVIQRVERISGKSVKLYIGDVRDVTLLKRVFSENDVNSVIHLAGMKSVSDSIGNPLEYYDVNLNGSITLLRAMSEAGVKTFVFSSTAAVYEKNQKMPLTETSRVIRPESPYGRSKLAVEQVLEDICTAQTDWSVGILRYFNPAGAHHSGQIGEDPQDEPANLIPYAMQVAVGLRASLRVFGSNYATPDGTGIRDYIHITDLANGHIAALTYLQNNKGHFVWNLGTGRGTSVKEVINGMSLITGKPLKYEIVSRREGDAAECWADPTRARVDLGWRAEKELLEMLRDQWFWQSQNPRGYAG